MTSLIGQQLGNYRLTKLLGQGSFADVYLGEHLYLEAEAAIKVLRVQFSEDDAKSFLKEARVIARLLHPHIVRVLDFGVQENVSFLVMDYAPNGTLRQRHPKGVPLPLDTIIPYVKQVASALQYAHDHKLIHRDVKPENMLLGRNNELWLSDFGIVQDAQSTLQQVTRDVTGTIAYMAPEQLSGKPRFASDQYALAVVVYEWLTGSRPFRGTFAEIANQHMTLPPPPLREQLAEIPPAVEGVIMTALAKDPAQRFPSMLAFANALEEARSSMPPPPISDYASSDRPTSLLPPAPVKPQAPVTPIPPFVPEPAVAINQVAPAQPGAPAAPSISPPFLPPVTTDKPAQLQPSLFFQAQVAQPGQLTPFPPSPFSTAPVGTLLPPAKKKRRRNLLLVALAVLVIAASFITYFIVSKKPSGPIQPSSNPGIGVTRMSDGEYIGISDGTFAFDTNQADGELKIEAADKLKAQDVAGAESLWRSATRMNTGDAEALIYLEDQQVLASHAPYVTFIVGTYLTGPSVDVGRSDLQGAYVAQKEFNSRAELPGGVQVRLLIANSGSQEQFTPTVARQIVQAARADKSIVGVMGWPVSQSSRDAISILAAAHIPMVSSTSSYDMLTGISPYFFRVTPSNQRQVSISTQYAEHTLHATKAALFVDPTDLYSQELANDFEQQFKSDGHSIVATEDYQVGHPQTIAGLLQDALRHNPNIIFFAGIAQDAGSLITALPTSGPFAHLQVIGGDRLFGSYPSSATNQLYRLHFTVLGTGYLWESLGLAAKEPPFFSDYPRDFNSLNQHSPNELGFTRADTNAMFSYDAMLALLTGSKTALASAHTETKLFSSEDLRQALSQINGRQAIQGVSGAISFGADGNAINKVVILEKFDAEGNIKIDSVQGTFLVGS